MVKQMDSKVPKVRFHGFSNEWKEEKLGDKVEFFSGLTYSPNNVQKGVGTLVLRSSNVKNGRIVDADDVYVDSDIVNCKKVEVGDIAVVVRNGSRSLIGKHAQIKKEMENTVVGAFMTGIKSQRPDFITALLDTAQFNSEIAKNLGATINQITTGAFRSMLFYFSEHREEEQIGAYFKELDRLIELHQHKHNKLVTLKQAMLQKMFPQDGATTPEIRFKGFDEDWRDTTLGEQVAITMGQSPLGCTYTGNPRDFILVQGNADMKDGYVVPRVWTTQITKMAHAGDLVLSVRAPVGDVGKTSYDIVLGRGVAGVKGNEFIYQSLKRMKMLGFWRRFSSGSTFDSINSDGIKSASLTVPCNVEQKKIGNYLRKLDDLISQHFIQIDKLKQIKSACLEKMFV